MSSDSLLNANSEALTSDCMLGLKPSAPKSRSYRVNISPSNKSVFTPLDTIYLDIPTRPGCWLDQSQSYLKFSVQVSSTVAAIPLGSGIYFDNSAYSLLSRVDIFNSSNLLESIGEYGELANALIDTSLTGSDKAGLSTLIGTNSVLTMVNNIAPGVGTAVVATQTPGDRSGMSLASVSTANGISTAIPYTFCLPLLGGVLGAGSKMIPLKDLSAPINIQIYLASIDDAFYYGVAGAGLNYQIVNVEYVAQFVEINDDRFNFSAPGVPQYISSTTYRQASTFLPSATSGEISSLISIRAASLTQLLARFRNQSSAVQGANATAAYRKSSSVNPNLSYYYWKIGSQIVPNKPVYLNSGTTISGGSECFAELLKSFHTLTASIGNTTITNAMYNVANTASGAFTAPYGPSAKLSAVVPDTHANAFMIGTELQTFSNRNDVIMSGISTLNTPVYLTMATVSGQTIGSNITVDVWGAMDVVYVIQDGIMSARF